jgi:hypothetical protein
MLLGTGSIKASRERGFLHRDRTQSAVSQSLSLSLSLSEEQRQQRTRLHLQSHIQH